MTKILILGHARHGKDAVAELIVKYCPHLKFMSSSMFAAKQFIFEELREKYGYATFEECFADRMNHREEWYNMIIEYNHSDCRLTREILAEYDIYVGMRDATEYRFSRDLFTRVIWVTAAKRMPLESEKSMNIKFDHKDMIIIDNNGTYEELEENVRELCLRLFQKKD